MGWLVSANGNTRVGEGSAPSLRPLARLSADRAPCGAKNPRSIAVDPEERTAGPLGMPQ